VLNRLRIRAKLTLVAAVPLLCLVVLVVAGSLAQAREAATATQLADEVRLSVVITDLVHELQRERGLSSGLVGGRFQDADRQRVDAQRVAVDNARRRLAESVARFGQNPAGETIETATARLHGLEDHRAAIDARSLDVPGTLRWYTDTVRLYLDATAALARSATATGLVSPLNAYGALSEAKEAAALERGMMNGVFGVGAFGPDQYGQFLTLVATQKAQRDVFAANATDEQRQALDAALVSPEIARAARLEQQAIARPTGALEVRPGEWWDLMTVKIDRYRTVEERLADDVVQAADALAARARTQLLLFVGGGFGLVVLSGIVVLVTAQALSRPMRALTDRAYRAARADLPDLIASLQDLSTEPATTELAPITSPGRDEVAELATAFDSVQQAAVDLAVDQAMLRRNVAEMFINLGRRNQALIGRQLSFIDRLERDEADPDQLEKLFRLDHMTTRMRRNAESLLVLAGAELPRRWAGAAPIADIVRAGLSEIEDFARVELADLGDAAVVGSVATDLTHLLAELLENATTFSPPSSRVEVHGTRRAEGYLLAIVDHGIGMSEAQLADANARIDELARFDRSPSKLLGLYVVGRLAARHGVTVRLVESVTSGLTAKVLIPASVLEPMPAVTARPGIDRTPAPALVGAPAAGPAPGPACVAGTPNPVLAAVPPLKKRVRRDDLAGSAVAVAPFDSQAAISSGGDQSLRALRKRVRGAQLPDPGSGGHAGPRPPGPPRTADAVGASLGAFQAAVDRGRRAAVAPEPGLRGPNAETGLRGPNAETGLRGPNAETGLRGPNAETGLRGPNAETGPPVYRSDPPSP
jgi:signal transduction histidine kinase